MRIKHLSLENFRGFEKLEVEFPENGSVVFIGVNGAGKSSILEGCAILINIFYTQLEQSPERIELSQRDIKLERDGAILDCSVTINDNPISIRTDLRRSIGNLKHLPDAEVVGDYFEEFKSKINKEWGWGTLNIPFFTYYPTNRFIPDFPQLEAGESPTMHQFSVLRNAFVSNLSFSGFFKWFRAMEDLENEKRLREDPKYRDRGLAAVRNAIQAFLPGFSQPFVKRQPFEEFVVEKNGEQLSISQLSHGEKGVLTLIGDIARRSSLANPSIEDPLSGKGIVLIDEAELHLHPGWQRSFIPTLESIFPNIQFILTTHSPQVLSRMKQENVFILDDFELVERTPHTFGRDTNTILQDLFNVAERPENAKEEFRRLYRLMDDPDKMEEALNMLKEMEKKYGGDDPEIMRAKMHQEFINGE